MSEYHHICSITQCVYYVCILPVLHVVDTFVHFLRVLIRYGSGVGKKILFCNVCLNSSVDLLSHAGVIQGGFS